MGLRTHIQRITAGNDFNGAAPGTTPVSGKDVEKSYPTAIVGGLFDFELADPVILEGIQLKLGGQTDWTIHLCDPASLGGTEYLLWAGTTETDFITVASDQVPILQEQTIKVRTTAAVSAMVCKIFIRTGPIK